MGRLLTLYEKEELQAALIIVPGPIDVQQIRRLTAARRMLLFVALERDLIQAPPHAPTWRSLGGNDRMELTEVLRQVPVAELPRTMQPQGRGSIPVATLSQGPGSLELLASELTIPEKRMLDLLHDWADRRHHAAAAHAGRQRGAHAPDQGAVVKEGADPSPTDRQNGGAEIPK